ncbi:MAG TPA: hypothetical protein PK299_11785 [Anaerolineales bacterium]|nr:hypothetical protein [Anaerolineales bacterium]
MYTTEQIEQEWHAAMSAEKQGNAGKARVCARRAVGWAGSNWLAGQGIAPKISAMSNLRLLAERNLLPTPLQPALSQLNRQVNLDHDVPGEQPFLDSARTLLDYFLG